MTQAVAVRPARVRHGAGVQGRDSPPTHDPGFRARPTGLSRALVLMGLSDHPPVWRGRQNASAQQSGAAA